MPNHDFMFQDSTKVALSFYLNQDPILQLVNKSNPVAIKIMVDCVNIISCENEQLSDTKLLKNKQEEHRSNFMVLPKTSANEIFYSKQLDDRIKQLMQQQTSDVSIRIIAIPLKAGHDEEQGLDETLSAEHFDSKQAQIKKINYSLVKAPSPPKPSYQTNSHTQDNRCSFFKTISDCFHYLFADEEEEEKLERQPLAKSR